MRDGTASTRPSGRCSICQSAQRLRKDGTLGRHHLWSGHQYIGECPGTGKTPAETTQERVEWNEIIGGRR